MSVLTHVQRLKLQTKNGIVLIRAQSEAGLHFYAYIKADAQTIEELGRKYTAGEDIIIQDYGEVVESGIGKEPPDIVKQKIKEEYGFEN